VFADVVADSVETRVGADAFQILGTAGPRRRQATRRAIPSRWRLPRARRWSRRRSASSPHSWCPRTGPP